MSFVNRFSIFSTDSLSRLQPNCGETDGMEISRTNIYKMGFVSIPRADWAIWAYFRLHLTLLSFSPTVECKVCLMIWSLRLSYHSLVRLCLYSTWFLIGWDCFCPEYERLRLEEMCWLAASCWDDVSAAMERFKKGDKFSWWQTVLTFSLLTSQTVACSYHHYHGSDSRIEYIRHTLLVAVWTLPTYFVFNIHIIFLPEFLKKRTQSMLLDFWCIDIMMNRDLYSRRHTANRRDQGPLYRYPTRSLSMVL